VTIFGESAGGLSVFSQLASPSSEGFFHKAFIESGAYALNTQTLAAAEAAGTAFAAATGCSAQTATCLRALPVTSILANEDFPGYTPNIDGEFFPLSLNTALATGQFHHVPVIQGSNHDEWRLFTALDFDLTPAGPIAKMRLRTRQLSPLWSDPQLRSSPCSISSPVFLLRILPSPRQARMSFLPARLWAPTSRCLQFVPLSTYEFSYENAPQDFLPSVSFPYAAAHASELQYLFALPITVSRPPLNAQQLQLTGAMQHYWTNFAKFGNPNGPGVPVWQEFNPSVGNFQSLIPPSPL
jgi:para-nitrobenzyl esterase